MMYDLNNIWDHIRNQPIYIVILLLVSYILFYLSLLFEQGWYINLFAALGWLSISAIVAIIIADLIVLLIKATDDFPEGWKLLPFVILPISYVGGRILFSSLLSDVKEVDKTLAILFMIISVLITVFLLYRFKTNKFKKPILLKKKKKKEKEKDGGR